MEKKRINITRLYKKSKLTETMPCSQKTNKIKDKYTGHVLVVISELSLDQIAVKC